ncbi:MAG: nucleotidyltransferase family protein [Eubacteriales bacterium]|nr:nucleotidyltransferase family protein [Eubacteriales bacterium]MDD4104589.1 nucleotidyltransferase family protein [Eubacteriales bacterium]MDD4710054.1 nucleotidyltransferase family protein [Eubacteriales bacterium]
MMVEGVVLAAGESKRTSPDCKLAFKFGEWTLLEESIVGMRPYCKRIFVVTGAHDETINRVLNGYTYVTLVHNPAYAGGMFTSVKAGLRHTLADGVFILPGDCPFAVPEVYEALLAAQGRVVIPTCYGRDGHPVLLRREAIDELLRGGKWHTLREFIATKTAMRIAVDCPGILKDIDTLDMYLQEVRHMDTLEGRRCWR